MQLEKTEVVFCTVPYTETTLPLMAPAVLKSIATRANKTSVTVDLNLELIKHLESSNVRYELLEFFHSGQPPQQVEQEIYDIHLNFVNLICAHRPDIVGLSVFTYNCQASTKLLCFILKKINPDIKIIIGGAGIGNNLLDKSKFAESLLKQNLIDFYIKGDGENSLYEYLTTQSENLTGVNSDHWINLTNEDLARLPLPDYSDYDFDAYDMLDTDGHRVVPILGSRGCVRNCSFCDIHNHWNKFTWRAGEHVFEEMVELNKKYQSTHFMFQDSLINGNQKEYKKMCHLLADYNQDKPAAEKFKWGGFFILRPKNQFREEDWRLTAEAGAHYLAIGIETFNDEARFHLGKKFTNEDIEFGLEMIHKYNIPVIFLFFTGYITDTEADIAYTEEWLKSHVKYQNVLSLNLGTPLGILAGTPLHNNFDQLGLKWIGDTPEDWYNPANDNHPLTRAKWNQRIIQLARDLKYRIVGGADNRYILERMLKTYDPGNTHTVVT